MPAVVYLHDNEVREWRRVPDDKDCDKLLQDLRRATGEDWIIGVHRLTRPRTLMDAMRKRPARISKYYTLYADCHGEWQMINLVTPRGGSVFHGSDQSREDVMNFIIGMLNGIQHCRHQMGAA